MIEACAASGTPFLALHRSFPATRAWPRRRWRPAFYNTRRLPARVRIPLSGGAQPRGSARARCAKLW